MKNVTKFPDSVDYRPNLEGTPMTLLQDFLKKLKESPESIEFDESIAVIKRLYSYTPTAFDIGDVHNEAGQNEGSCKILSFARLQGLNEQQTLACFGSFYRDDVLKHPDGDSHQNIRNFMKTGWQGVRFAGNALTLKQDINSDTPVTIIVKRRPRPGLEKEFEEVVAGISRAAMAFEGHLGVNIFRPTSSTPYYRIVFKFDSRRNFIRWETSDERQQWLERFSDVDMGDPEMEVLSGLETWFTANNEEAVVPPPRHKMVIVLWISISMLSILLYLGVEPFLGNINSIWRIIASTLIVVLLMTYLVMPILTRILHRWLHTGK